MLKSYRNFPFLAIYEVVYYIDKIHLMIKELQIKNTSWILITRPTREDIDTLRSQFPDIHPLVLEDLRTPTIRPFTENYERELYLVMHFPILVSDKNKVNTREIDFILRKKAVITVQYEQIPELEEIQAEVDKAEEEVFAGREKEILTDITILKRDVLDFSRAVKPQRMTLESLLEEGPELYGAESHPFLKALLSEYNRVANLLENHKEALDALYDTTSSQIARKTNEIMRVFTILAFITFIPTVVANIYGMNVVNIPFANNPLAFWIVIGFMIIATVAIYLALKWRKLV